MKNGFTIIELMVAIAIAAILVSIGMPAMQSFISNGKISRAAASLVTAVNQARSEAISTGKPVSIFAGSDKGVGGNATTPNIGSLGTSEKAWSDGFRLLRRTISSGSLSTDASDTTLLGQTHFGYTPDTSTSITVQRVTAGTHSSTGTIDQLTFNRVGQLVDETSGAVIANDVQIWVCDNSRSGEQGRRIIINNRGNIKNYAPFDTNYSNPCT